MGKAIAEHFGFEYIDKEILVKAAAILDADEENLELVDENVSALTAMARSAAFEMPYIAKEWYIPTSDQLFKTQTEIMRESVEKGPCVIIGRCASYLFRHYEKHTSIFLQADMDSRIKRLEKTLDKKLSEKKAVHDIEKQDRERAQYYNTFTGKKWLDLRQYDLVLDTSQFSDEEIKDILFHCITVRFPELKK